MSSRWPRLEPKVSAVVRAATASAAAMTVVRSGTAVRPRPPSSAWRVPRTSGSGRRRPAQQSGDGGGRVVCADVVAPHGRVHRQAVTAPASSDAEEHGEHADADHRDVHLQPGRRLGDPRQADRPQRRERDRDHHGATTVASSAIDGVRTRPVAKRSRRVMPSARSTGWSVDSKNAWREALGSTQERGECDQSGEQPQHDGREVQRAVDVRFVVRLGQAEEHRCAAAEARDVGAEARRGR